MYNLCMSQGVGEDVPVYMRYEGKLRKRKMDKNDAGILIKEVWREKTKHNQEVINAFFLVCQYVLSKLNKNFNHITEQFSKVFKVSFISFKSSNQTMNKIISNRIVSKLETD